MLIQSEQQLAEIRALTSELRQSTQDVLERVREARGDLTPIPELIAFVHIPKTAGGTVKTMFAEAYSSSALRDAGNYLMRPEGATRRAARPLGGWDAWVRNGGRVTIGHTPYGLLREHLPSDTRYMTFLRDPVERVLSHYHRHIHLTRAPEEEAKPKSEAAFTTSIEDALEMDLPELNNLATRFLCDSPAPPGELPPNALEEAKANLRGFAFVGIQERFEESIVLLQRTFGLDLIPFVNRHVSLDRPTAEEITAEQRGLIAERNRLDDELYEYALTLFEDTVEEAGGRFADDVETLRAKSEGANEEALHTARDWLLRELPPGASRPRLEMLALRKQAGISMAALKDLVSRLPVRRGRKDDGQVMWSLTEEARTFASGPDLKTLRERTTSVRRAPAGAEGGTTSLIAFVHVERTAGAITPALEEAFSTAAVRAVGDYFRSPHATGARLGRFTKGGWETWRRGGGRVVSAHVPYGLLREHLPADTPYVTFLRDPIDRVLSHYHGLIRRRPDDQGGPKADSLEVALVELRLPQLNNLATRYLCGHPSPLEKLPASALEDAKENLRRFAFVGLRERFEESIVLLGRTLGADIHHNLNRNITLDRPGSHEIPAAERALIADHNWLDAELYAFAEQLMQDAVAGADDDFRGDVEALRAAREAADREAIQRALDWLERELPPGNSIPKGSLTAKARLAEVPIADIKQGMDLLSLRKDEDPDGQTIWSRPA